MKSVKLCLVAAALSAGVAMAAPVVPYVVDTTNAAVASGSSACVRTGFWTPALAEQAGSAFAKCEGLSAKAPAKKKKPAKVNLAADALFGFGSAKITEEGAAMLNGLIARMAGVNVDVIIASGYADRIGSEAANDALSAKRAEAVKAYLVKNGVASKLVSTQGLGSFDPVVNCPDPSKNGQIKTMKQLIDCLAPNRRTAIEVFGSRAAK